VKVAARTVLLIVGMALAINFLQGGPQRVIRWSVRTLTGKDLRGPS
jgi:hypothetical protein